MRYTEKEIQNLTSKYIEQGFSQGQVKEIKLGLKQGVDVSIYAKPEFTWNEMKKETIIFEDDKTITLDEFENDGEDNYEEG